MAQFLKRCPCQLHHHQPPRPPFLIVLILDRLVCCDWGELVKPPPPSPPHPKTMTGSDGMDEDIEKTDDLYFSHRTISHGFLNTLTIQNLHVAIHHFKFDCFQIYRSVATPPSPPTGAHVYGLCVEISREIREVLQAGFCLAWLIEKVR
jgi:hypothetical protein